jgi:hypothetical protein
MKIFKINGENIFEGVFVDSLKIKSTNTAIPVIQVGEEGRGRYLASIPIQLVTESYRKWQAGEPVNIRYASIGFTRAGAPKIIEERGNDCTTHCLIINVSDIGFRGGNYHFTEGVEDTREVSIDIDGWAEKCLRNVNARIGSSIKNAVDLLSAGLIAQGDAGRMGNGIQYIGILTRDKIIGTERFGRLYGEPDTCFYFFNGSDLLVATKEERIISEIF